MLWEKNALIGKAKNYIQRAFEAESRDSELFPFWATIGLEFVGRAVLASVHPSLLADPQTPEAVLFACGIGDASKAKSVYAKTVFARCRLITAEFNDSDFVFCMSLMEKRNEELHTSAAAFEDFPTEKWLADYYRVLEKLLKHLELDLNSVLTDEDANAAAQMVAAASKALLAQVKKKLADHKTAFSTFAPETTRDVPTVVSIVPHFWSTNFHAGEGNAVADVVLDGASGSTLTVDYSTSDGTATSPSNYSCTSGTLTFTPGMTIQSITVPTNTYPSSEKDFSITLSNPSSGLYLSYSFPSIEIALLPTLTVGTESTSANYTDSSASVTINTSDGQHNFTVTVSYTTNDGSASAGTDYTYSSGTATIQPGFTSTNINVPLLGAYHNGTITDFQFVISSPSGAVLASGAATATVTIIEPPAFSFSAATINAAYGASTNVEIDLSYQVTQSTTVDIQSSDGTASSASNIDYNAVSYSGFLFDPDTSSLDFSVSVANNSANVGKTFFITLSNPSANAGLGLYITITVTIVAP